MLSNTLPERLEQAAAQATKDRGLIFVDGKKDDQLVTWQKIAQLSRQAAHVLQSIGLQKHDRVAIVLPTCLDFFEVFFGSQYLGAVPTPLYPPLRFGKMDEYISKTIAMLKAAQIDMIITNKRIGKVFGQIMQGYSPKYGLHYVENLKSDKEYSQIHVLTDDLAMAQFSSGTTVSPKPVGLTHRQVLANADIILQYIPVEIGCSWLPLYHDMGLVGCIFTTVSCMGTMVLIPPEKFLAKPVIWLQKIAQYKCYISPAPNFAYAYCTQRILDADLTGVDLSCWKMALNGAEAVSPQSLRDFNQRFAPYGLLAEALTPVYGMAEASLAVSFSDPNQLFTTTIFERESLLSGKAQKSSSSLSSIELASVGKALPGFEIEIRKDQIVLDEGNVGSIFIKGPSIMKGYLNQDSTAASPLKDGWLDTGDVGFFFDSELYIYGRQKDIIIKGGQNHAPQDIEQALDDLEHVRRGCSVAVGDITENGEAIYVFVESSFAQGHLIEQCKRHILSKTGIECDLIVLLAPGTIPRTSSGKLRRQETLKQFQQGTLIPPQKVNAFNMAGVLAKSMLGYWRSR